MKKAVAIAAVFLAFVSLYGCTKSDDAVVASKRAKVEVEEAAVIPETNVVQPREEVIVDAESGKISAPQEEKKEAAVEEKTVEKTPAKEPAPQKAETKTAAKSAKPWIINVASLTEQKDALKLKSALASQGYNAYVTVLRKNGKVWHRVRVGFYATREEAKRTGEKIDRLHKDIKDPWVAKAEVGDLKYAR